MERHNEIKNTYAVWVKKLPFRPTGQQAVFINEGLPQAERLAKLNAIAISQMNVLTEDHRILQLEAAEGVVTNVTEGVTAGHNEDTEPDTKD